MISQAVKVRGRDDKRNQHARGGGVFFNNCVPLRISDFKLISCKAEEKKICSFFAHLNFYSGYPLPLKKARPGRTTEAARAIG